MPVKIKFSQKKVADLQPEPGKQVEVWDTVQPRFGVRVSPGGRKVFFVMCRVDGKLVRSTVGQFPEMNVDTARTDAAAILVRMQKGENPNAEKRLKREQQADKRGILSAVFESYLDSGGKEGNLKATTIAASIVPGAMVDCLSGHVPQDVTGKHYTFPSVGQLRPHAEAVTAEILRLAGA